VEIPSAGIQSTIVASPAERQTARDLLSEIGKRFAENRKKSKSKAFESYQQDLANNSGTLVMGGAVTLKELTVLLMDLEAYMKSTVREGETAATRLQKFLSGKLADEVE
jgi:DNA topoisomerase VI subunit B